MDKKTAGGFARFLLPTLFGVALFMVPVTGPDGSREMLSGLIVDCLEAILGDALIPALVLLVASSAVLTLIHALRPLTLISESEFLKDMFEVSKFWLIVRIAGAAIMLMAFFKVGPATVVSEETGGNILFTIVPACALWYVVGGLFLPFLTDFGLVDLFSALFRRFARPVFKVPGSAMVDCISSWLGSSVCGVYLTITQYEKGYYTGREAVILLSGFELLSISFCSMIASMLGIESLFGPFYATIALAGLVCALILPRIRPINAIPDEYCEGVDKQIDEAMPDGVGAFEWGCVQAIQRAADAPSVLRLLGKGALNALSLMVSTLPSVMAFGTVALVVATYTDLFDYLGVPLGLYLSLFDIPNAMEVGSTILVGFADQFVPVILASAAEPVGVRFLIGCLSILQILYMTDIGALILTSKVPFKFWQIFVVYLERIVISIPVVVLCGHIIGVL